MYKSEEEFVKLINYYLDHEEERKEKAKRAQKITIERFGADKLVGEMAKIMREYVEKNGVYND
jgi:spore maturation protein CgeB